jgi:AcrR family transcriptional regulator
VPELPKIVGGNLAEHRVTTRERLFASLGHLMRERGFPSITLSDIAAEAGVGRTAVYNHFADKESLLLAYITDQVRRYVTRLEQAIALTADDPLAQLRTYVRTQVQLEHSFHLPGADVRAMVSPATAARLHEHSAILGDLLRRMLAGGIAAGVFPRQNVDISVALVNSCLTGRVLPRAEPERSAAIAATEEFVLRAVGARAERAADPPEPLLGL